MRWQKPRVLPKTLGFCHLMEFNGLNSLNELASLHLASQELIPAIQRNQQTQNEDEKVDVSEVHRQGGR